MKRLTAFLMVMTLGSGIVNAQYRAADDSGFGLDERALESAMVEIFLRSDGNGRLAARECQDCDTVNLKITPDTQVIVGGKPVRWNAELGFPNQRVDVFYDVNTKKVARIVAP